MANLGGVKQSGARSGLNQQLHWLDNLSSLEVENSVILRALVQALVIVGIIATDVAASDVTVAWSITSYWAVPLSIVGAVWSWRRRRYRNIPAKFLIAIGMLVSLVLFFGRLGRELNDTRLALALLLIELQVLHSFDLPRRKDLGYSMVIGLILLGVAGTLSQTLAFGAFLLVFMAIAIPVLVLDYRSRLFPAGKPLDWQSKKATALWKRYIPPIPLLLSPRQIGVLFLVTLTLGLSIFALLPRLPGYQLRTFPVSNPSTSQESIDATRIINPGYVRGGRQSGTGRGTEGSGQRGQGTGPGKMDETYYYGFDTQINQNLRGSMKPQVVLRVRSQAEGFWRVMSFDRYTGQGWEVSRNDQSKDINRPSWTFQFVLPLPPTANRTREIVQSYTVVAEELPNIIPALYQPKEVYFPTQQLGLDPEGSLRSPLALVEGFTYTVVSEVPFRDRTKLRLAPTQYPGSVSQYYLQVPDKIKERVRQKTEQILSRSPNPLDNPYEKSLYLAQYLKQNYTIQPDLPFFGPDTDLVEAFLFQFEGGYRDHFSTVFTVMLRSIGIPARLVTGFGPGQFNPFTGLYIVKNVDAYAMTEVYFPKYGWFAFNPMPGFDILPPSIEDYQTFTVLQQFWKWIAGWLPSPILGLINGALEWITRTLGWAIGWMFSLFNRGWLGLFLGLILLTVLGFLGWLAWQGWRFWQYQRWLAQLPPMESLYQQLLVWLLGKGFRKQPAQTPLEYVEQVRPYYPQPQAEVIEQISRAYVGWRYGGRSPNVALLKKQFQDLRQRSSAIKRRRSTKTD